MVSVSFPGPQAAVPLQTRRFTGKPVGLSEVGRPPVQAPSQKPGPAALSSSA